MADTVISLSDDKLSTKHIHSAAESLRKAEKVLNDTPYAMCNSRATENSDGAKIFLGASADVEAIRTEAARLRAILEDCESILKSGPESLRDADKSFKGQFDPDDSGIWKDIRERLLGAVITSVCPAYATYVMLKGLFSSAKTEEQVAVMPVIDKEIKEESTPPVIEEPSVIVNESPNYTEQWHSDYITPPKTNKEGKRSAEAYREVMAALDVENNYRYKEAYNPYWGMISTMCNVYVFDVLVAMNVPLSVKQFGCSAMMDWMGSPAGQEAGWVKVDQATAIEMANQGFPTVAGEPDHVAMVAPQHEGDAGCYLSQAGRNIFEYGSINMGWKAENQGKIQYFYHV